MLQIGEWTVHQHFDRLTRADDELHITPRAMDVLMHLTEHAGELVTKEELLNLFWRGAISGDNAVHKTMAELRRVFSDDSRNPAYIQTYPKRGYRLIAAVKMSDPEATRQNTQQATAKPDALPPENTDKPVMAVLPLLNMVNGDQHRHLGDGIAEDIANYLGISSSMDCIAHTASFILNDTNLGPIEIGSKLGASHLVEGSVRDQDDMVRVTIQLIDTGTGKQSWSSRYDRYLEDSLAMQEELASTIVSGILRHFGFSLQSKTEPTMDRSYLKELSSR